MTRGRWQYLALAIVATLAIGAALRFSASAQPSLSPGGLAMVVNTDGDGLNLRDGASLAGAVILTMPEGTIVEILATGVVDPSGLEWSQVRYAGSEGFSAASYLAAASVPGATPTPEPPPSPPQANGLMPGSIATVSGTGGEGLNVRAEPDTQSAVVSGLLEGMQAQLIDGPVHDPDGNPWYLVEAFGITGWAHGGFLTAVPIPIDEPPADDVGAAIVAEALTHLGAPFTWAGTTPEEGFDCSGFTYYVINTVLGNDFPRDIDEQVVSGEEVSRGNLQPGDLVFFENTYEAGLSHVGIYIGDGRFVNGGSEIDVVAISYLEVDYWDERYLTARRIR